MVWRPIRFPARWRIRFPGPPTGPIGLPKPRDSSRQRAERGLELAERRSPPTWLFVALISPWLLLFVLAVMTTDAIWVALPTALACGVWLFVRWRRVSRRADRA